MSKENLLIPKENLTYAHHNFDLAKDNLKNFSIFEDKDFELEKVKEERWGLWDRDVTGAELNSRLSNIQKNFISVNSITNELRKEFGVVYNALDALDKDILNAIKVQLNSITDAYTALWKLNNNLLETNEEIKNIIEKQDKTVKVLSKFKGKLDEYKHLSDVDNIWRDMNTLKSNVEGLREVVSRLEDLEYLYLIDTLWFKVENLEKELIVLSDIINNQKNRIEKNEQKIIDLEEFRMLLENQEHLHEIDILWTENLVNREITEENKVFLKNHMLEINNKVSELENKVNTKTKQIYICLALLVIAVIYIIFLLGNK